MSERDVFTAALRITDPVERSAYLDRACAGDARLRQRVELLLRTHGSAGEFLQRPAVEQLAGQPDLTEVDPELSDGGNDLAFLQPSSRPGSLGRLAQYEILEVLGRGGFGVVLKAFDEKLHRLAAVKVLGTQLADNATARKRFVREARAAAAVRNEHVVGIYAVDEQPIPYLVMEYIGGQTLQQKLDRSGPLELKEVLRIGCQIAEGLAAAHRQGLIHRDIKPGNILLENGVERVKITDFGLARAADDASLSQSGLVAGTPMFMAPEQAQGQRIDHRADLFSLGSVLYVMCTGRPPFRAGNTLAVLKRVCEETPRPIDEVNPDIPRWLCDIIRRLHAKKPDDRFGSAREVADLLARHLADVQQRGSGQTRAPAAARGPAAPVLPRRRRWAMGVAILVLLGFAGLALSEATHVTDVRGTVLRLFSPEGTLVVEVDDPAVSVAIDGEDMVITGAGVKEIRLKPGQYKVKASKDGKVVSQELVSVTKNGRQVVRVSRESASDAAAWERSVALMPADEQVKAVAARLKERNLGFDGAVTHETEAGVVTRLAFRSEEVTDLSPVRALSGLRSLACRPQGASKLADLSPLKGLSLTELIVHNAPLSDLTPLRGMPLAHFDCTGTKISDLSPLTGMPLTMLSIPYTAVSDLSPLKDLKLGYLNCSSTRVADLSPVRRMPLETLLFTDTPVTDLSAVRGMSLKAIAGPFQIDRDRDVLRSLKNVETINFKPMDEFWKEADRN